MEKEKRRVYQVAKEKKLSSDALISMLKSMGFDVKSHMSLVDVSMLDAISKKIEDEKKNSRIEVQRQKEKEEIRQRSEPQANTAKENEEDKPKSESRDRNRGGREKRDRRGKTGTAETSGAARSAAPDKPVTSSRSEASKRPAAPSGTAENNTRRERPNAKRGSNPTVGARPEARANTGTAPLPEKEEGRSRRRGKREEGSGGGEPKTEDRSAPTSARKESQANKGAETGGRWRGGRNKKKRQVDTQAVQENVRKTLSQLNEGRTRRRYDRERPEEEGEQVEELQILRVHEFITVGDLAKQMEARPAEVITACIELGVVVSINQRLEMDTIITVADEFGFEVKPLEEQEEDGIMEEPVDDEEAGEALPRSPVVTVMGHVDHGKTSLLDHLRKTNVAAGESGGITQHIGAYTVRLPDKRKIAFLDTPGHAAFTAMRARGARVTDLVILVVAADDSVMPQTIEAIDHAKAAQVPIVVAINKIDLPTADVDRIKRELAERGVLLEDWGGNVASCEISALTGQGIDKLLELVLLEAELLELTAVEEKRARGTIIEAKLDKGRGAVATVLVQEGTLRQGDTFVTGVYNGRVRALLDENMQRLNSVGPSTPIQVLGLGGVPQAGDSFSGCMSEKEAKEISQKRQLYKREQDHRRVRGVTLTDLQYQIQQGQIKELNVIIKGDVDGSVEAINQELGSITHEEVRIAIIHSSVGTISESDVLLAIASRAVIVAFRVPIDGSAREMASKEGIDIHQYSVIYEVVDEMRAALSGLLTPDVKEQVIGKVEVRQIFSSSRMGLIAGCIVQEGKISRNNSVRLMRNGEEVYKGSISSLRRFKDDVREVLEGFECGISLTSYDQIQEHDVIEVLETVESVRTL